MKVVLCCIGSRLKFDYYGHIIFIIMDWYQDRVLDKPISFSQPARAWKTHREGTKLLELVDKVTTSDLGWVA